MQDDKTKKKKVSSSSFFFFVALAIICIALVELLPSANARLASAVGLGGFMILGGAMHFAPSMMAFYLALMPPFFPFPEFLIYATGVLEAAAGACLFIDRSLGARLVFATLVIVYPANIWCAVSAEARRKSRIPTMFAYVRLPIQGIFLYWAYQLF